MYKLIKKVLLTVLISTVNAITCTSIKDQKCKAREVI